MRTFILALVALFLAVPALADDKNCSVISAAINPTEAGATDDWINLVDSSFDTTNAAADAFIVPFAGRISEFTARVDVAPTADDSWDIYVSVNGTTAATSVITCEILGASAVTCISSQSVSVSRGDDITVLVDSDDGTADPAAAAELSVSLCLTKG
jgi:hypothetical protein